MCRGTPHIVPRRPSLKETGVTRSPGRWGRDDPDEKTRRGTSILLVKYNSAGTYGRLLPMNAQVKARPGNNYLLSLFFLS